ncbi:hypothetical protein PWT90_09850 [Aphanocladium album]|nr:hypothetical protein PWT90_09850 [Aphanocladium album]
MNLRSPSIDNLNHLLVASPERFGFSMGCVKHLLLRPYAPCAVQTFTDGDYVCCQKFQALCRREYAKLMFSSLKTHLSSITIPFEIMNENLKHAADLLLQTAIQFLAIDISYCQLLADCPLFSQDTPLKLFENLRALAIYYPETDKGIDCLCGLLARCRLKFFHLEHQSDQYSAPGAIPKNLLLSLKKQTGLEVLALNGIHHDVFETSDNSHSATLDDKAIWPKLKALYLRTCNLLYLKQLLKFKDIQVLSIQEAKQGACRVTAEVAGYIATCGRLRAIDLQQYEFASADLVIIARSCPQLKYLRIGKILDAEGSTFTKNGFLSMIRSLPFLEYLGILSRFRIDGVVFKEISSCCPRLAFLELPKACADLSLMTLYDESPLSCLRGLELSTIWFERPKHLSQPDMLQSLAEKWRTVFPALMVTPCAKDEYWRYPDGEETSDVDMVYQKPRIDFNDEGTSWLFLRLKLWRILGYEDTIFCLRKMKNIWKRQFEVETFGWPVVPFEAFLAPYMHATASRNDDMDFEL